MLPGQVSALNGRASSYADLTNFLTSTYTGTVDVTVSATTITFSSVSIGAADPSRWVAFCFINTSTGSSLVGTTATIGGATATISAVYEQTVGSMGQIYGMVWGYAYVPTGTTANIVVTCPTAQRGRVFAFSVKGINTLSVYSQAWSTISTNSTMTTTVNIPTNGLVLYCADNTGGNTPTLSGTAGLTTFNATATSLGGLSPYAVGASSKVPATAGTGRTIIVSQGSASNYLYGSALVITPP